MHDDECLKLAMKNYNYDKMQQRNLALAHITRPTPIGALWQAYGIMLNNTRGDPLSVDALQRVPLCTVSNDNKLNSLQEEEK